MPGEWTRIQKKSENEKSRKKNDEQGTVKQVGIQ